MENEKQRLRAWAQRHGLSVTDSTAGIAFDGSVESVSVEGEATIVERREVDELRRIRVTREITVELAATPRVDVADLQVTPEGIRAKMSKLFGGQDIITGDAAFDPEFLVRGRAPDVEKVLGAHARKAMLEAHAEEHEVCIDGGRIVLRHDAATDDVTLDSGLAHLVRVANAIGT